MVWIRDRALSLVLIAMLLLCLAGQLATGVAKYNSEQVEHGEAAVSVGAKERPTGARPGKRARSRSPTGAFP